MTTKPTKSVLRLRKKHTPAESVKLGASDGRELVREQSLRDAVVAALITIVVFSVLWAMLSTLLRSIYPWMTLLLGFLVGLVVRRAGHGVDWRFPAVAAVMTVLGALLGYVVVAAAFTAESLGASTVEILRAVTAMTWPVFFDEVISGADIVYALFGAGIAAFYANRRLSRDEYHALRKWQEQNKN